MKISPSPFGSGMAAATFLAASLVGNAVSAQTVPPPTDAGPLEMEKMVVTATKRSAALTDVSLALSALPDSSLAARGIDSLEALAIATPGMDIVKVSPGDNLLVSRGISTTQSLSIQSGPAVGVYIDEMPFVGMNSYVPDFGLWDVSRVEILRGPQGTLYGEGAMAGTIRIISHAPDTKRLSGKVQLIGSSVRSGDYGRGLSGMVNLPLVSGVAALRVAFAENKDPAWIDVPELGKKDANTSRQSNLRVSLLVTPTSKTKIDATYWHQNSGADGNRNQTAPGVYSPPSLGPVSGTGVAPMANAQLNSDCRRGDMANVTLTQSFELFHLVSATSYSKQRMEWVWDARDTLPIGLIGFGVPAAAMPYVVAGSTLLNTRLPNLRMLSEELRLVSAGNQKFNWTVGGYVKDLNRHVDNNWLVKVSTIGLNDDSTTISDTTSRSQAIFGEGDWKVTDRITVTAGLRQYRDIHSATANVVDFSSVFGVPVGIYGPIKATESQTTYNAIASWKITDQFNGFARVASGFRSGGPNLWVQDPVNIPKEFKAEKIQSLEAGVKTSFSRRLAANVYVFENWWKDKQVNLTTPDGLNDYLANASQARSQGVEFEAQVFPARGLGLTAVVTYTDATITRDLRNSTGRVVVAKSGSQLPYSAEWEFKAAADYHWSIGSDQRGVVNLSYRYRGKSFSDISNLASSNNGDLDFVDLRAGIEAAQGAWGIFVSVHNLADSAGIVSIQQATGGYGVRYPSFQQPRTLGVEFRLGF